MKEDDTFSSKDSDTCSKKQATNTVEIVGEQTESIHDSDSGGEEIPDENIAAYEKYRSICRTVGKYLENRDNAYFEQFLIPEKFFKRFWVMDIVTENDHNCCCFTKR